MLIDMKEPKLKLELLFELLFVLVLKSFDVSAPKPLINLAMLQPHSWQNFWLISFVPQSGQNFIKFYSFQL